MATDDPFFPSVKSNFGAIVNPFGGGVLARRPSYLPGGDPFAPTNRVEGQSFADGNITPQIIVEIAGDQRKRRTDIKTFTLVADVQSLYDPFSFVVPDPDGDLLWLVQAVEDKALIPIRIFHKDPFVNNGIERPWMQGVITAAEVSGSIGSGTIISVSGYDLGYLLTSCAPIGLQYNLLGLSWQRMVQLLFHPTWAQPNVFIGQKSVPDPSNPRQRIVVSQFGTNLYGFRAISGISLSRQLRQGKLDAEIAAARKQAQEVQRAATRGETLAVNNINFKAYTPKVLTQPGETVADIFIRYAKFAQNPDSPTKLGRLVNTSPEGDLEFFQPDYTTAPQFVFNYNRAAKLQDRNNVIDGKRRVDGEQLYPRVWCYGSILYGQAFYETDNPQAGMTKGVKDDYSDSKYYFFRQQTFADNERYDNTRAGQRALWRWNQNKFNASTVTFTVQGHSQNGIAFAPNSRAEVRSDILGVNQTRYNSRVEYRQEDRGEEGIASTAVISLRPDRLLAA